MNVAGIDHVQLAMPAGREAEARAFYSGLLGIPEVEKPEVLAGRGGVWFEVGSLRVHLGVDPDFRPSRKAHPAFVVYGLRSATSCASSTRRRPSPGVDDAVSATATVTMTRGSKG